MRVLTLPDVAGNGFMKCQVGQAVACFVQIRRSEIDPEAAGRLAVDRARAAVCARSAGLLLGRQTPDLHVRIDECLERARQLRPDPLEAVLNERHDLGAALVAFRKLVLRVLRQCLHPFAYGSLRVASPFQDLVHLRVQALQLAPAHFVDLVRRHVSGRRGVERPPVVVLAVWPGPHPGFARRNLPLRLQLRDLPLERRRNVLLCDLPRARGPVSGDALRSPFDGLDERPARARAFFADRPI